MTRFKVYTKSGDRGKTSLATGERVSKSDFRIECYGTVDELNALIGLLRDKLPKIETLEVTSNNLLWIQNLLFDIGAELSCSEENIDKIPLNRFKEKHIQSLENEIDLISNRLPILKNFILPGGHEASSQSHVIRTVCRRVERLLIRYKNEHASINDEILIFFNRLSDYFFVLSRLILLDTNSEEVTWTKQN